jgi:hypothetical protein
MIESAASALMHAVEYNRRELLAMRRMKESANQIVDDALLSATVAAAKREDNADAEQLSHFPWFAFVVQFVATRLCDGDMRAVRCSNALLLAMPAFVRSPTLGGLIRRLSNRVRLPDVWPENQHGWCVRVDQLLERVDRSLSGDTGALLTIADEFVALALREYDAIADELRWLVLPQVVRRRFQCRQGQTLAWSDCGCKPRLESLKIALNCACAPDTISASHYSSLTRARLLVLLCDAVEHYLRVGGASFVRRAVIDLIDFGGVAEIDDDRDESLLHLCADVLGASIVVARSGSDAVMFRPTAIVANARVVVFRQSPRDGTWCVGELQKADVGEVRSLGASRDCRMILFNAVRSGEDQLGQASTWAVQIHGLQHLVGEESKWLNGDAVYGLVVLATRGIEGVRVLNPLLIDKSEQWELSVKRACARLSAKSLLVPWNERDGHWSLLYLDLVNLTAVCCNSLDQPISAMMRQFSRQAFGKRWRGTVQKFDSPLQDDGHNCGVFVVFNAFHLARGQPLPDTYRVTARTRVVLARAWLFDESIEDIGEIEK